MAASLLTMQGAWAQETQPSIPRGADGKPDFSGIWQTLTAAEYDLEPHSTRKDAPPGPGIVEGQFIPYRPEALQQRKTNFDARATDDPRTKCFTLGTPRGIYSPEPFQIFQRSRDLTLVFQFGHSVRTIHTNETGHPKGPIGFWLGDSRGRWDGDTLVVDVVDFNGETWLDRAGNFHSDQLHVVERWSFLDANTIQYTATLDDPDGLHTAVEPERDPASAPRAQLPADRELLLHARLRQVLSRSGRTVGSDDLLSNQENIMKATGVIVCWLPSSR